MIGILKTIFGHDVIYCQAGSFRLTGGVEKKGLFRAFVAVLRAFVKSHATIRFLRLTGFNIIGAT